MSDLPPTYTQEPSAADVPVSEDNDHDNSDTDTSFVSAPDGAELDDPDAGAVAGPQILIIPVAFTLGAFIGMAVTSAGEVLYGKVL